MKETAAVAVNKAADLSSQVVEALKPVAEKLGVAATHLYQVMARQSAIEGVTYLVSWSIAAGFLFYVGIQVNKYYMDPSTKMCQSEIDSGYIFSWVIRVGACLVLMAAVMANLPAILNPEYYAIKELLTAVQSAAK